MSITSAVITYEQKISYLYAAVAARYYLFDRIVLGRISGCFRFEKFFLTYKNN